MYIYMYIYIYIHIHIRIIETSQVTHMLEITHNTHSAQTYRNKMTVISKDIVIKTENVLTQLLLICQWPHGI